MDVKMKIYQSFFYKSTSSFLAFHRLGPELRKFSPCLLCWASLSGILCPPTCNCLRNTLCLPTWWSLQTNLCLPTLWYLLNIPLPCPCCRTRQLHCLHCRTSQLHCLQCRTSQHHSHHCRASQLHCPHSRTSQLQSPHFRTNQCPCHQDTLTPRSCQTMPRSCAEM